MNDLSPTRKKLSDEPRAMPLSMKIFIFVSIVVAALLMLKFLAWFAPWFIKKLHYSYYPELNEYEVPEWIIPWASRWLLG